MKLTLDRLEKVRPRGLKIIARCPACAEMDRDKAGDNLAIFHDGHFACAAHQQDREHSRRILQLAGNTEGEREISRPFSTTPVPPQKPAQNAPPQDFAAITLAARQRVSESLETQANIAAEFGVRAETIRQLSTCASGGIGLFSSISIGGRACLPDRIGYIYPQGIKIRHPWGPDSRVRFAWAWGRATEPWRYSLAAACPWVHHYYITEGESDLIALLDSQIEDLREGGRCTALIASPGTSFREDWVPLFRGRTVTLVMDADAAGAAATQRVGTLLRRHADHVRFLTCPRS